MENLLKNGPCPTMAGNRRILIAPTDEVQSIDFTDFATKSVTFKTGCAFAEIQAENIQLSAEREDGGFAHQATCRLTGTKWKYDSLLEKMGRQRWIVKVVDNNGQAWLSGSLSEPLLFEWAHKAEAKPSDGHSYELTFKRRMSEPLFSTPQ